MTFKCARLKFYGHIPLIPVVQAVSICLGELNSVNIGLEDCFEVAHPGVDSQRGRSVDTGDAYSEYIGERVTAEENSTLSQHSEQISPSWAGRTNQNSK